MTGGIGHERRADNAGHARAVPDAVSVVSPIPAIAGYGRPRWWQRLRSAVGLVGLVVICGVLVAAAIAATLLAIAVVVATAFGVARTIPDPMDPLDERSARRRAAAQAGHTGDEATARSLLDDAHADVRATALGALERLGALRPTDLVTARGDTDPIVRRRAAEVLAAADDPDIEAVALAPLLDDPDITVAEVAAWAVGERLGRAAEAGRPLPEDHLVGVLASMAVDHTDALCREAAVAALGAIGDARALPAILAATTDKATVRRRAVLALAPFEGPEVDDALERARDDRDWQVRQAAEDLLD